MLTICPCNGKQPQRCLNLRDLSAQPQSGSDIVLWDTKFLAYNELQFFPAPLCCTHWNSHIKYSLSSLASDLCHFPASLCCCPGVAPVQAPTASLCTLGWLRLSSLVFEEFPYFLGYLKHTLCSLNKREDLGENLFNITTIGQIFPK